ncbi:hypothetical protein LTR09_010044 [Extremus antarcticus]|uniref:Alpha-galactosidase n=1 Tax=Extremus antarcticus TaxID=702011 RepID=A0AAJ0D7U1_9PEZI|nr:hypothetical protein LTR09_010044 [Extremus antarcticus]
MADLLPEQIPPEQAEPANKTTSDDMDVKIVCWPPLGQATTVISDDTSGQVQFTVLLEHQASNDNPNPEVVLWHNHNNSDHWNALPLQPQDDSNVPNVPSFGSSTRHTKRWFKASLEGTPNHSSTVSFTLKYRLNASKEWRWIKDATGIRDGTLHCMDPSNFIVDKPQASKTKGFEHFFSNTSSDIKITPEEPETTRTQLWSLTTSVASANGEKSGYAHHRLGKVEKATNWFALVRLWSPWLAPRQGLGEKFELDKDGVLLSFLRSDGLHVVCLAISGVKDVLTTFINDGDGNMEIKGRNDRDEAGTSTVLVAVAEDFERAESAVMDHARKVISQYASTAELAADTDQIKTLTHDKVKPEWLEEWYDGLTYCTWNGLGQNLSAEKIYTALDELARHNINVTNLIIDDNWQSLSSGDSQFRRGWSRFEANDAGFPGGLKTTTKTIRNRFPNINHIAVWHAILGYWGGIYPSGEIAQKYRTKTVEKEPGVAGGSFTVVTADDAKQMYDGFYRFLSSSGIDAVKTDAQFFLDLLDHAPDRRHMITEYQDAWTLAHLRHFSSRAISCMSQFPQALFHSQLPQNKPRLLVRNSDDFFPEVEASHAWHIFCNAHNSVLTQYLNVLPDWDMFQTSHSWASFHAAARCVSGGPIYFTDKPGEHDIKLINQMTAQTVRKKTVILRPHRVGRAMGVYNAYDAKAILKVGTFVGMQKTGTGILGCFNVSQQTLREFVRLEEFPGTEKGKYVVGSFCSGRYSGVMSRESKHAMVVLELETRGWDILTANAVRSFTWREENIQVAMLGLVGKMTGAAAVSGCDMYIESNGRLRIWVSLKALGTVGLWLSNLGRLSVGENFMVIIFGQPIPQHCVTKADSINREAKNNAGVLQIDVERAWKEMELEPGWSNEVSLEVFIG